MKATKIEQALKAVRKRIDKCNYTARTAVEAVSMEFGLDFKTLANAWNESILKQDPWVKQTDAGPQLT